VPNCSWQFGHLGTLVISDITFDFVATAPFTDLILCQKTFDFAGSGFQFFDLLGFTFNADSMLLLVIDLFVLIQHPLHGPINLFVFLLKLFVAAAPLFGGIGGEFAAINGEHLFTDQSQLVAHQNDLSEEFTNSFGWREMKSERVVKCGRVSAESAMKMMFSRQSRSILRLLVIPLE